MYHRLLCYLSRSILSHSWLALRSAFMCVHSHRIRTRSTNSHLADACDGDVLALPKICSCCTNFTTSVVMSCALCVLTSQHTKLSMGTAILALFALYMRSQG